MSSIGEQIDMENTSPSILFDRGWSLQRSLIKTNDESSDKYTLERKNAIEVLEKCQFMLDELHMFSKNEGIDEISPMEIRYLITDALLGWLYSKVNSNTPSIRLIALDKAKRCYLKYLELTQNYGLHKFNLAKFKEDHSNATTSVPPAPNSSGAQAAFDKNLINMAEARTEKIRRYKEQKELEAQLEATNSLIESLNSKSEAHQVDDEQVKKLHMTYVKYWVNKSMDEIQMADDELRILGPIDLNQKNRMNPDQSAKAASAMATASLPPPKQPFIITKDALQAKVFGAGYPSLPVYSVEEFYDNLADRGHMPHASDPNESYAPVKIGGGVTDSQKQDDKAEKDRLADANDEEELRRQREWDEFKDDTKRGEGNRYNRS